METKPANNIVVLENQMTIDSDLQKWMTCNSVIPGTTYTGLTWVTDEEYSKIIESILKGDKKHIMLCTSYMDPDHIEYVFEQISNNVSDVTLIMHDDNKETIINDYKKKYPSIKFTLLDYDDYMYL